MATDVNNLVPKIDTACITNSVLTKDTSNMTHHDTVAVGSQFAAETQDMGCDGIAPAQTCSQGNQSSTVNVNEAETSCKIIVPDSDESSEE